MPILVIGSHPSLLIPSPLVTSVTLFLFHPVMDQNLAQSHCPPSFTCVSQYVLNLERFQHLFLSLCLSSLILLSYPTITTHRLLLQLPYEEFL